MIYWKEVIRLEFLVDVSIHVETRRGSRDVVSSWCINHESKFFACRDALSKALLALHEHERKWFRIGCMTAEITNLEIPYSFAVT